MNNALFHCRIMVFDREIQDLTVFVWELEPLDRRTRSAREWIEEHIKDDCENLLSDLGIEGYGGWEAVFIATIHGYTYGPSDQEDYDEDITLEAWEVQRLPSEMFV